MSVRDFTRSLPIREAGTYAYKVTIPPPDPSQIATDCSGAHLVLTNDSGTIESLAKRKPVLHRGQLDGLSQRGIWTWM